MSRIKFSALIAALLAVSAGYFHYFRIHDSAVLSLDLAVETGIEVIDTQLFFDTGDGFNQQQSVKQPVLCDGEYHRLQYGFVLEKGKLLRLDPLSGEGMVRIREVQVSFLGNLIAVRVDVGRIQAANQIESIVHVEDGAVLVRTVPHAIDPSLLIQLKHTPLLYNHQVLVYLIGYLLRLWTVLFLMLVTVMTVTSLDSSKTIRSHGKCGGNDS